MTVEKRSEPLAEELFKVAKALPELSSSEEANLNRQVQLMQQYLMIHLPEMSRIFMHTNTVVSDKRDTLAYASAKGITLCRPFFLLPNAEQAGVFLHEVMHVLLQHISRCQQRHGLIWNWATDLVINEMLITHRRQQNLSAKSLTYGLPSFGLTFNNTPGVKPALDVKPASQWTAEELYSWMLENLPESDDDNGISIDSKYFPNDSERKKKGKEGRESVKIQGIAGNDLDMADDKNDRPDEMENQKWDRLLKEAMAGSRPNSLLLQLERLLPSSKVDWRKELRRFLRDALNPQTQENWSRPSRFTLAGGGYFEPARTRKSGIREISIVLDTSGSCFNKETLQEFFGEIQALNCQLGAQIHLVQIDTEIKHTSTLTQEKNILDAIKTVKGGGGTDLLPGIEYADARRSDAVIVLSDGYLSHWPKKVRSPLIFVLNTDVKPPIGKTIRI